VSKRQIPTPKTPAEKFEIARRMAAGLPPRESLKGLDADPLPRIGPRVGGWSKQIKPPWVGPS
jgi:hypothetical protein